MCHIHQTQKRMMLHQHLVVVKMGVHSRQISGAMGSVSPLIHSSNTLHTLRTLRGQTMQHLGVGTLGHFST
jgi:hypothetical protein